MRRAASLRSTLTRAGETASRTLTPPQTNTMSTSGASARRVVGVIIRPLLAVTGSPSGETTSHSYAFWPETRLAMRSGSIALVSAIME